MLKLRDLDISKLISYIEETYNMKDEDFYTQSFDIVNGLLTPSCKKLTSDELKRALFYEIFKFASLRQEKQNEWAFGMMLRKTKTMFSMKLLCFLVNMFTFGLDAYEKSPETNDKDNELLKASFLMYQYNVALSELHEHTIVRFIRITITEAIKNRKEIIASS